MSRGSGHGQAGVAVGRGDRTGVVGDEFACRAMIRLDGEDLRGAQRRERHRPRPHRPTLGGALELDDGRLANPGDPTVGGGGSESPDASPPTVLQGRLVGPTASAVHPVAAGAGEGLRLVQEPQGNTGETVQCALRVGLSGGDNEDPGHVVGAVAVFGPGLGETGVLEGAATVCHSQQMVESRVGRHGHTSAGGSARSRCARTRYALATTDQAIVGASRRASAAMEPARRGSVSTRRRADVSAPGSS